MVGTTKPLRTPPPDITGTWNPRPAPKKLKIVPTAEVGLELFYKDQLVETLPRLIGGKNHRIDYRHVIASLVRKPGAFANYRFREDLYPTLTFRRAYDALVEFRESRASVEYVRILHLAAKTSEMQVEATLAQLLEDGVRFDYAAVKALVAPRESEVPVVNIQSPNLAVYDALLRASA